ncbi:MAG: 30S ribosomal protein S12 methylthiotransferase RimO [Atopobiaceae bacterium]|nr:30S ribosomal protein S12 methylthiotransferase RimO [Atopobiaceae bacterium]
MERVLCFFITLGCAKNEVDTDRMRALLLHAGYGMADSIEDAQVVIINTCSFLATATSESIEATLTVAGIEGSPNKQRHIIMCGCVPSRYGEELESELPEVAAFVPAQDEDNIVEVVSSVIGVQRSAGIQDDVDMLRTIEGTSAYVKISDGCDRFCTFCAIPYIRGRYASRPANQIIDEVKNLMRGGVREIVLIGQDTGIWGQDFEDGHDLAWLLGQLSVVVRPYGGWLRVLYLQPEGMTERLIATIRDTPEVLPYIDIPIQHCSRRVLDLMGRPGSRAELKALFNRLRDEIPNMVLRSTGLVGFPTETDEEFEELLEFIQEVEFDYTSVFAYSQEEGTIAAELDGQIDEETKTERAQRLIDVTEQLGFSATSQHVGEIVDVIIDGVENTDVGQELIGHAWFQAPDCDGSVHIAFGEARVGDVVTCKLVDSFCYELVGEIINNDEG